MHLINVLQYTCIPITEFYHLCMPDLLPMHAHAHNHLQIIALLKACWPGLLLVTGIGDVL